MALVGILSRAPGPIGLTRLAGEAGLHTASAHRILGALMAHGLVEKPRPENTIWACVGWKWAIAYAPAEYPPGGDAVHAKTR